MTGSRDLELAVCKAPWPLFALPSSSLSKQQAFLFPSELLRDAHVFQSWEKEIKRLK